LKIAEVFGVGVEEVFQYEVVSGANAAVTHDTP
jgi:hypothetical protein